MEEAGSFTEVCFLEQGLPKIQTDQTVLKKLSKSPLKSKKRAD
jgi:hypothetical protein